MSVEPIQRGAFLVEGWREAGFRDATGHRIRERGDEISWTRFTSALRSEPELRAALVAALAESELEAFFWECVPRPAEGDAPFTFVLTEAPALARLEPDGSAFEQELRRAEGMSATFPNLGGDAELVVPRPVGRPEAYPHLARFVRDGPAEQVDAVFVALGDAIAEWRRRRRGRLWVSTSGLGVPWVHLRLDRRPKYYVHEPFRR